MIESMYLIAANFAPTTQTVEQLVSAGYSKSLWTGAHAALDVVFENPPGGDDAICWLYFYHLGLGRWVKHRVGSVTVAGGTAVHNGYITWGVADRTYFFSSDRENISVYVAGARIT